MKNKRDVKKRGIKKQIVIFIIAGIGLIAIIKLFFFLEGMVYYENYDSYYAGDCGQWVIWESIGYYNATYLNESRTEDAYNLYELALEENPLGIMTGPTTIKKGLKQQGIDSAYYNNFSPERIKQKIDENKPVIVLVNANEANETGLLGLHHFLFVYKYKETNGVLEGFYFTDAYYFVGGSDNFSEPVYFTVQELESIRQNTLNPHQYIGVAENILGMEKPVIVVGEKGKDETNIMVKITFFVQHSIERVLAYIGKVVMFFSDIV